MRDFICFCLFIAMPAVALADIAPRQPRYPGTSVPIRPLEAGLAAVMLSAAAISGGWFLAKNRSGRARTTIGTVCLLAVIAAACIFLWSWSVHSDYQQRLRNRTWRPPPLPQLPDPSEPGASGEAN
jgi:hypothetical protein